MHSPFKAASALTRSITRAGGLSLAAGVLGAGLLGGCQQQPNGGPIALTTNNPFRTGLQNAAVCTLSPITQDGANHYAITMTVSNEGGVCGFPAPGNNGKQYASYGVDPSPAAGQVYMYNWDGKTDVDFTPRPGQQGQETFGVVLIPAGTAPRATMTVTVNAGATPASTATPAATAPAAVTPTPAATAPKAAAKETKATKTKVRRHHRVVRARAHRKAR
ncbi:hypothetical protein E3E12_05380 [Formicincola oecophyllae]|uniref:Uncharacterized protein n=1 Tax=Formicincola oecophyllae TaxID=2558361 RepID=A0A4Y6U8E1_9PROT|nr:hypothetical protein [Formicincola oecophyllae]QDH13713.1 hypothetical protein E3E12_05380 [Formicincola oecophyllae]